VDHETPNRKPSPQNTQEQTQSHQPAIATPSPHHKHGNKASPSDADDDNDSGTDSDDDDSYTDDEQDEDDEVYDEDLDPEVVCFLEENTPKGDLLQGSVSRNLAIAYVFSNTLSAPQPYLWPGRRGTMAKIKGMLGIKSNTSIRVVLEHIWACLKTGRVYTGHTCATPKPRGKEPKLKLDSVEASMVALLIEQGSSYRIARESVNVWLKANSRPLLTHYQVYSLVRRLKPSVSLVGWQKQGSNDIKSKWCRASMNWSTQLCVRFGFSHLVETTKTRVNDKGETEEYTPAYYDKHVVPMLDIFRTAFWDETHKMCKIGGLQGSRSKTSLIFPRKNGILDPNGTMDEE